MSDLTNDAICSICGSGEFTKGPNGRLTLDGRAPRCVKCASLERHRAMRSLFNRIPDYLTSWRSALQFAPDQSFDRSKFHSFEVSEFGGKNSIDLNEPISIDGGQYDFIVLSQVLEFVKGDIEAFTELIRIGTNSLILCFVFDINLGASSKSNHFDTPQPPFSRFHYYAIDFIDRFKLQELGLKVLMIKCHDNVTNSKECIFLIFKSNSDFLNLTNLLSSFDDLEVRTL